MRPSFPPCLSRCFSLIAMRTSLGALLLAGCSHQALPPGKAPPPSSLEARQFAKSDIDRVVEAHQREVFARLRLLAEKLYKRNPREWQKTGQPNAEAVLVRVFDTPHDWRFAEVNNLRDLDALRLAFREDYTGDRVFALMVGLGSMVMTAFDDRSEFFIVDQVDAQKLYNSARNVEIAVWKLNNSRYADGSPMLLANEGDNLSFEREFGRVIGSLDVLTKIIADKTNRSLVRMAQSVATAVFLPIK